MIKKLMDWITGKSDAVATPVPYKVETPKAEAPSKSYPDHIILEMPNLSPTMEKVNLLF